jgi:hypothetical protein
MVNCFIVVNYSREFKVVTEEEKRLIIAKAISGLFTLMYDTTGFEPSDVASAVGDWTTAGEILALRYLLQDSKGNFDLIVWNDVDHIKSVLWSII